MNFVIPMAGRGERFGRAGYSKPKLLLPAHGKTLLEWSVDSLPLELCTNLIFVGLIEHETQHNLERWLSDRYRGANPKFIWIEQTTRGQAETVYLAKDLLDLSKSLLIFNIDTAFRSSRIRTALQKSVTDGVLGAFRSTEPRFSFADVDDRGVVREVREKSAISPHALTGLYHFTRTEDFLNVASEAIARDEKEKGEFFVAPLYNKLITHGRSFVLDECEEHWILGTPEEYEAFCSLPEGSV